VTAATVEHGQTRRLADLKPHPRNSRIHSPEQINMIIASMGEWDWTMPILIDEEGVILAGHARQQAGLKVKGPDYEAPVTIAHGWSEAQKHAYIIADNRLTELGTWDETILRAEIMELDLSGFNIELTGFDMTLLDPADAPKATGSLSARFGVPPFSVLSARDGWWQDRKRAWLALGIQSEVGRGEGDHNAAPSGAPMPLDRAKAKGRAE